MGLAPLPQQGPFLSLHPSKPCEELVRVYDFGFCAPFRPAIAAFLAPVSASGRERVKY